MERRITVKGIGQVTAAPDYVVINMTVEATDKKYEKAVDEAADGINKLSEALVKVGFKSDDLKTVDFRVNIATGYKKTLKGVNEIVKTGFTCTNRLKLDFDFDGEKLSKTVNAITNCIADPRLNITFTVKDEEKIKDELLISAAANARRRAQMLCESAGGKLGDLITIDYNWSELSIISPTRIDNDYRSYTEFPCPDVCCAIPSTIKPDDIKLRDNAVFVWEIV